MKTPGFVNEVVAFLPPPGAPGPIGGGGPHGPVVVAPPDPQAQCRSSCDATFAGCMAATSILFPFAIPVCINNHSNCLAQCSVVISPIGTQSWP